METAIRVLDIILKVFLVMSFYKFVYMIIGFCRKAKTFSVTEKVFAARQKPFQLLKRNIVSP